ncbi:RNA polymerase sigma factor [Nesterenkonia haasae]|uniref:RNA polymerase sigma factor n=1 Tax=Nesterenkonia haasae TaxID=2587813 RepID=UPI0013916D3D|nr:RNA polymerase sigma factor [Nesterenkonia haasae]
MTAAELGRALQNGDLTGARRMLDVTRADGQYDDALELLAQHAPHSPAVTELLIEALDASGVVHRFAGAALLDKAAVDDVAQDSLISVAESISSYDGRSKVTTWLHSIVRRRVVDHLRRAREVTELTEDLGPAERMSSAIATRTAVRQALAELPEVYRIPVTLRDINQAPYTEIAEQLGRPVGTVKSQVSRGRAMVAARLGEQDGRDTGG